MLAALLKKQRMMQAVLSVGQHIFCPNIKGIQLEKKGSIAEEAVIDKGKV